MLGVFKKRWKPKRNVSNVNIATKDTLLIDPPTSVIHVDNCNTISSTLPKSIHTSPIEDPKFYEERSSLSSGTELYPLAPNICVADGRIEFIRSPRESATYISAYGTDEENGNVEDDEGKEEMCDEYSETATLEARIRDLEESLDQERKLVQKEKLISAKLQRQLSRRELIQRDVDRERRLRLDAESKLRVSMSEAERCKTKLSAIQAQFTRMEDTVRAMVQYKSKYEHIKLDKAAVTRAYESEIQKLQETASTLHSENQTLKRQVRNLEVTGFQQVQSALLDRLESLEIENINLRQESDNQKRKYEKCLDDVAHQVVRAILSQKGLKEEVSSLRRKLRDAEVTNLALTNLLVPENRTVLHLAGLGRKMWTCELPPPPSSPCGNSLADSSTIKALPHQDVEDEEVSGGSSVLRDEGYSTMSSDVQGAQETPRQGLEGLAEIQEPQGGDTPLGSDSTSVMSTSSSRDRRYLKNLDSDIYLSVSLLLDARHHLANPRHSFPPCLSSRFPYAPSLSVHHLPSSLLSQYAHAPSLLRGQVRLPVQSLSHSGPIVPNQTIVRSLSDSHLCLNLPPAINTSVLLSDRWNSSLATDEDVESWTSGDWWDGDCVEHWLRLDEMRGGCLSTYDTSELEDWTMREEERSLSPCRSDRLLISPSTCDSWSSSSGDNCSESLANSTTLGVEFTRDFYRLVKFESTKSLSSTTSTSAISSQYGEDPLSRKRSNLMPNSHLSTQTKILRLEDLISAGPSLISQESAQIYRSPSGGVQEPTAQCETICNSPNSNQASYVNSESNECSNQNNQTSEIKCDNDLGSAVKTNIATNYECDKSTEDASIQQANSANIRISNEQSPVSTGQRSKCRKRIISGGACQSSPEDRPPPKPTRITSGGSCEALDISPFSPSGSEFSRLEFSPEDYSSSISNACVNPLNSIGIPSLSVGQSTVANSYFSNGCENLFRNVYETISLVPQYESNNVDQLYGSVRWNDDYATDSEDRFWMEMDKERDRFWSTIDKDRSRFWKGSDKERDREEEGEIECLQEDFTYDLSSRGVSRNGLRSELNTVIEENEDEDPSSLPPSPLNQSNSTISHHLQPDPAMTRSMASSISTPDTVVNIHDTRPTNPDTQNLANTDNQNLANTDNQNLANTHNQILLKPNQTAPIEMASNGSSSELSLQHNEAISSSESENLSTNQCTLDRSVEGWPNDLTQRKQSLVESNKAKIGYSDPMCETLVLTNEKMEHLSQTNPSELQRHSNEDGVKINGVQTEFLVNRYECLSEKSNDSLDRVQDKILILNGNEPVEASKSHKPIRSDLYENIPVQNLTMGNLKDFPTESNELPDFIDSRTTSKEVIEQLNRLIENSGMEKSCDSASDFLGSYHMHSSSNAASPSSLFSNFPAETSLYSNIPNGSCNTGSGSCKTHKEPCPGSRKRSSSSKIPIRNNSSYRPVSSVVRKSGSCNKENGSCSGHNCSCKFNGSCQNGSALYRSIENGSCKKTSFGYNSVQSKPQFIGLYNASKDSRGSTGCASVSDASKFQYTRSDGSLCSKSGWVHVEKHIDLADPKARANLLDVMLASSRSSSSSEEEGEDHDPLGYYHLHALHRFRRQKKAAIATREPLGALRFTSSSRTSILGRDDFYVRYGAPEQAAMASFDFLDTLSTGSSLASGDEEKVTEL